MLMLEDSLPHVCLAASCAFTKAQVSLSSVDATLIQELRTVPNLPITKGGIIQQIKSVEHVQ
jgi:hypothetical protein